MRAAVIAGVLVAAAASPAEAGRWNEWTGGATVAYDARYTRASDGDAIGDLTEIAEAGLVLRGVGSKAGVGLAAQLDFHLGGGLDGGFAYELDLLPVGYGANLGRRVIAGIMIGAGFSGVTDRVPFAWQYPVEVFVETDLGKRFHLSVFSRAAFIGGADERQNGADNALFGDETSLGVALRFNRRHERYGYKAGNGYYVGAVWNRRMDVDFTGVSVGYGIHMIAGGR
jgi:hypothetical protein